MSALSALSNGTRKEWKELTVKEQKQAVESLYGRPEGRKLVDTFQLRIDES